MERELLLEIGTEELPASWLPSLTRQIRDGLDGATTREIAREAGVNEVTLFRHFGSRERLLRAVVERNFGTQAAAAPALASGNDLRADLRAHARAYEQRLEENMPLIRAMHRGTPAQSALIRKAIEEGGLADFGPVMETIRQSGALDYVREQAQAAAAQASDAVRLLPNSKYRDCLLELAAFAVTRNY